MIFDADGQHYQDGYTARNMRSALTNNNNHLSLFMLHFTVISHSLFQSNIFSSKSFSTAQEIQNIINVCLENHLKEIHLAFYIDCETTEICSFFLLLSMNGKGLHFHVGLCALSFQ